MYRYLLAALLLLACSACFAFEPRFYGRISDPNLHKHIFTVVNTADRFVSCIDVDKIDVGISEIGNGNQSPIYFKRSQIHRFLDVQKDKNLLVIMFLKPIMGLAPLERQKILDAFKVFIADLGYKRVLILVASAAGIYVLDDTDEAESRKAVKAKSGHHH